MTLEELKRKIRNEERKINEDAAGADWELYRAYQRKLAQILLAQGTEMLARKGARRIKVNRSTLRLLNKKDFPQQTVIAVGNYRITIAGEYGRKTTVFALRSVYGLTRATMDLTEREMPQYIHRFIFC